MKTALLTSIACLATFVFAQVDLNGLPDCAKGCLNLNDVTSLGCSSSLDINCICKNKSFIGGLACCVSKNCKGDDIDKTIKFANGICAAASVSLPQTASCTSSAGASASSGSAKSTGSAAKVTSAASKASSAASASAAGNTGSASSTAGSATASAAATGAAVANIGNGLGAAGGLAAALVALL